MVVKILIGIGVLIAGLLTYVAVQPSHSVISREVVINAPAEKVFPYVNTRSIANSWNPWLQMDPKAQLDYGGPDVGAGARTNWHGGEQLGTGSATVTESVPNQLVKVKLEYKEPFEMTQDVSYILKANGDTTTVVWQVEGESTFAQRLMCVFMNMDKTVGDVFTKGLGQLKTMVETAK